MDWFVKKAKGNELLAIRHCLGGITWGKKAFIWPWESYKRVDLASRNYKFDVHCLIADLQTTFLSVHIVVGPDFYNLKPLTRYTSLIFSHGIDLSKEIIEALVWYVVEHHLRVLVSSLTKEAILAGMFIIQNI